MLCVRMPSMMSPGTINAPWLTALMSPICVPMAEPNTTKYRDVDSTGETML